MLYALQVIESLVQVSDAEKEHASDQVPLRQAWRRKYIQVGGFQHLYSIFFNKLDQQDRSTACDISFSNFIDQTDLLLASLVKFFVVGAMSLRSLSVASAVEVIERSLSIQTKALKASWENTDESRQPLMQNTSTMIGPQPLTQGYTILSEILSSHFDNEFEEQELRQNSSEKQENSNVQGTQMLDYYYLHQSLDEEIVEEILGIVDVSRLQPQLVSILWDLAKEDNANKFVLFLSFFYIIL